MKIIKVDKCLHCPYFSNIWEFQCRYNGCKINDPYKEDIPEGCALYNEEDGK